MKKYLSLIIVGIILIFISSCGINKSKKNKEENTITVLVKSATKDNLDLYLDLYGTLESQNEVQVFSDVPGKVAKIVKLEGERVSKQDIILYIDRSQIGLNYELAPVRSPVSGYVTSLLVNPGQQIAPSFPVAKVGDITVIECLIRVPEPQANLVKIGQKVLIKSPNNSSKIFNGIIYRKDLSVDPLSRTLLVRARFSNPTRELLSGMYVNVSILIDNAQNVFVLPNTAFFEEDGASFVFVATTNNIAKKREVKKIFSYKDKVAISDGISEGEKVVIFGREFLKDGSKINPIEENEEEVGEIK